MTNRGKEIFPEGPIWYMKTPENASPFLDWKECPETFELDDDFSRLLESPDVYDEELNKLRRCHRLVIHIHHLIKYTNQKYVRQRNNLLATLSRNHKNFAHVDIYGNFSGSINKMEESDFLKQLLIAVGMISNDHDTTQYFKSVRVISENQVLCVLFESIVSFHCDTLCIPAKWDAINITCRTMWITDALPDNDCKRQWNSVKTLVFANAENLCTVKQLCLVVSKCKSLLIIVVTPWYLSNCVASISDIHNATDRKGGAPFQKLDIGNVILEPPAHDQKKQITLHSLRCGGGFVPLTGIVEFFWMDTDIANAENISHIHDFALRNFILNGSSELRTIGLSRISSIKYFHKLKGIQSFTLDNRCLARKRNVFCETLFKATCHIVCPQFETFYKGNPLLVLNWKLAHDSSDSAILLSEKCLERLPISTTINSVDLKIPSAQVSLVLSRINMESLQKMRLCLIDVDNSHARVWSQVEKASNLEVLKVLDGNSNDCSNLQKIVQNTYLPKLHTVDISVLNSTDPQAQYALMLAIKQSSTILDVTSNSSIITKATINYYITSLLRIRNSETDSPEIQHYVAQYMKSLRPNWKL